MGSKWNKKVIDPAEVRSVASKYNIDLMSATIFSRRGITEPREVLYFLDSDPSLLHNPYLFNEMEDAIERILEAREEGERVKIFGDRDADGITSTVLMYRALTDMGIDCDWALPLGNDPYGLTKAAVDQFAEADGSLLITVDCGISNHEEIAYAHSLGIHTIVIDHHNPQETLPSAHTIINPKINECGYPFRDLAGCGVTAKVVWALRFAQTRYYNHPVCLLTVKPGNDSYMVEAALLINLVEIDRITETLVPGMVEIENTRLVSFLRDKEIIVHEAPSVTRMLQQVFGAGAEINLSDLAPESGRISPKLAGKSLLRILEENRAVYYGDKSTELDVLIRLFHRYVLTSEKRLSKDYSDCLDLVAIGTLADLMPLRDENRILVQEGLKVLSSTRREGLRELLIKKNLYGKQISTTDVGWQVSPMINATGRLGVPNIAAKLILSDEISECRELADEIGRLNTQRKKLGDDAWNSVLDDARECFDELAGRLVIVGGEKIHRGITGILASRLAKFFSVPAIVVAMFDGKAVGSARSVKGINVKEMLDGHSDLFLDYGGHDFAAGFSLILDRYDEFLRRMKVSSQEIDEGIGEQPLEIDAEIPSKYMTTGLKDILERFSPFGESNPPLVFLLKKALISELSIMGKRDQSHVKMLIDAGATKWPAVFWNAADRVGKDFSRDERVDIAFRLGINNYQHRENLQLTIVDIER